jgi:hypothetical protein
MNGKSSMMVNMLLKVPLGIIYSEDSNGSNHKFDGITPGNLNRNMAKVFSSGNA